MKRSQRLAVVVTLAQRKADESARALAYIQQRLQADQQQLQQLEEYLVEYRTSLQTQGQQGVSAQQFRVFVSFSQNVERAIEQQKQQVATVIRQVDQVRRHWQRLDARHKGLEKLHARLLTEESAAQERLAQKEQDEFAVRWRGNAPWK
ncbi:MAG: flagellar export protein FliJ [Gammaproteobacteria bacterium]|nr:flagellar export protein FliJ [Gammaproteobacteria bacterium]